MWLVIHRSDLPNIVAGPFTDMNDATNFSVALAGGEFNHDAVSVFNSLADAVASSNEKWTFERVVPVDSIA